MNKFIEQNLINPIEAVDKEKHKENLFDEIKKNQIFYADQLYQKYQKENHKGEQKSFSDFLSSIYSDIVNDLTNIIRIEHDVHEQDEINTYLKKYAAEVNCIYSSLVNTSDISQSEEPVQYFLERQKELAPIFNYFKNCKQKSQEEFPEEWGRRNAGIQEEEKEKRKAGLLDFHVTDKWFRGDAEPEFEGADSELLKLFKQEGLDTADIMDIHLQPDIFIMKEQVIGKDKLKKSFEELAEIIIKEEPQVQAIIMQSWLLDHPLFKKIIDVKIVGEKHPNWLQLIDNNGQISEDKLKYLIEKGELPYKNLLGYIKTEDFLKKYLPKNERGAVTLKEINPEWIDMEFPIMQEVKQFQKDWINGSVKNKKDIDNFLKSAPNFNSFLKETNNVEEFMQFFEDNLGHNIRELGKSSYLQSLKKSLDKYFSNANKNKYIDKKVFIE